MKTIINKQQGTVGGLLGILIAAFIGMIMAVNAQELAAVRTAAELDALLAPVALYPDDLIAVMLPAATAPADIVLAARFNTAGGAATSLDEQAWDDSVRTLAHYPELTQWMSDNLEWTRTVGEAFRAQPADVMAAIQRLRTKAQALGNLTTTPQQRVINTQSIIQIVPAEPEVIYVPQYDPQLVFLEPAPFGCSWISYGFCWQFGGWHRYDFDWRRCDVRIRERHPLFRNPIEVIRPWHPAPVAARPTLTRNRPTAIPMARPLNTANVPVATRTAPTVVQINHERPQHFSPQISTPNRAPAPVTLERTEIKHTTAFHPQQQPAVIRSQPAPDRQPLVQRNAPIMQHAEPRVQPQQNVTRATPAAQLPGPIPRHDVSVRAPAPVGTQPVIRETARQELRINPNPAPIVRQNGPALQEPRVMRTAPAVAQPISRTETRATQPAPVQRNTPQPASTGNAPANGDRSLGGRWGNVAGRGN